MKEIQESLKKYIEEVVFPEYEKNEKGHGIDHIHSVIQRSLELAKDQNVDINLVYVIAAYHDIGHHIDYKNHETVSAKIFMEDQKIKEFFTDSDRKIIKEAIEDHRSSNQMKPRSIYGEIISSADRGIPNIENSILRSYYYSKQHFSSLTEEEHMQRIINHLHEKYGRQGYAKIYLTDKKYENALIEMRTILEDEKIFREKIIEVFEKENKK